MQEVPDSNLGRQIDVLIQVYRGFPQSLHANNGIMPKIGHNHSTLFQIYYPVILHYITSEVDTQIDQRTRQIDVI
jgi:hypothetical protein